MSFLQGPEGVLHVLQQLGKVCSDLSFAILHRVLKYKTNVQRYYDNLINEHKKKKKKKRRAITYLELHGADFVQDLSHVLPDHGPGDFVVTLRRGLHGVPRHVVKCNHV